jgi:hypothetical protein
MSVWPGLVALHWAAQLPATVLKKKGSECVAERLGPETRASAHHSEGLHLQASKGSDPLQATEGH